jgi:hypothetical protein
MTQPKTTKRCPECSKNTWHYEGEFVLVPAESYYSEDPEQQRSRTAHVHLAHCLHCGYIRWIWAVRND